MFAKHTLPLVTDFDQEELLLVIQLNWGQMLDDN